MRTERGQLLLPMLAVMTLFGVFWAVFAASAQSRYWQMRMDIAAEMTALSATRQQAEQLNLIASWQLLENTTLQKAKIVSANIAHMQVSSWPTFELQNAGLRAADRLFVPLILGLAQRIARANGADTILPPIGQVGHGLKPIPVTVGLLAGIIPKGVRRVARAYYARTWWPRKTNPQPNHRSRWYVRRKAITGFAYAGLWMDVKPGTFLANGGFPADQGWGLREQGIQCHFPQFNARLLRDR